MKIINYDEIDSTQLEAKRLIENSEVNENIAIVAKNQTAGMGTHGRKWISRKNESITFTIILQPNCNLEKIENFTIKVAECIVQSFLDLYNIKLNIKEPNDIYFNEKKIGGILTESKVYNNIVKYILIGIGLNTVQVNFDSEIQDIASSIKNEFGIDVDNEEIIKKICENIEEFCKMIF